MYLLSLFLPSLVKKQIEKTDGLHKLQSAFYGIEAYDEQFREYCIFMPVDKVLANDEFVDTRKPHPQSMQDRQYCNGVDANDHDMIEESHIHQILLHIILLDLNELYYQGDPKRGDRGKGQEIDGTAGNSNFREPIIIIEIEIVTRNHYHDHNSVKK